MERDSAALIAALLVGGALYFGSVFLWGFCFPPKIRGFRRALVFIFGLCAVTAISSFLVVVLLGIIHEFGRPNGDFLNVIGVSFAMTLYIIANMWWAILAPAMLIAGIGLELAKRNRTSAANRDLAAGDVKP